MTVWEHVSMSMCGSMCQYEYVECMSMYVCVQECMLVCVCACVCIGASVTINVWSVSMSVHVCRSACQYDCGSMLV